MIFKGTLNKVNNQRATPPGAHGSRAPGPAQGDGHVKPPQLTKLRQLDCHCASLVQSTRLPLCFTCSGPITADMPKTKRQPSRGRRTSGRQSTRAASRASQNLATQSTAETEPPASDQELNPAVLAQLLQVIRTEVAAGMQAQQPATTTGQTTPATQPAAGQASQPATPSQLPASGILLPGMP